MKLKKGITWLRRDFEKQLGELLAANHVVSLGKLVDFVGRDKVIENMISREELEEANYADIQRQKVIDELSKKQFIREEKRKDRVREEEKELKKVMGL